MEPVNVAMQSLLSTAADLWPAASRIEVNEQRHGRQPHGYQQEFLVVPNAKTPRILIPRENARAAAGSMRRYSAAISLRETLQRLGLAGALSLGMGPALVRDRISITAERAGIAPDGVSISPDGAESLIDYLATYFAEPVSISLTIGPARANRKPVLQVFDRRGRSLAFVKVGDTPSSAAHVDREASSLEMLATRTFSTIAVPALFHRGQWNGMAVLIMSALRTGPRTRSTGFEGLKARGLKELATSFGQDRMALAITPMWSALREDHQHLADPEARETFAASLARAKEQFGDREVEVGAWHGDCSPWNMAHFRGRLHLWDWERFEQGVPMGMDFLHYALNKRVRQHGASHGVILAGLLEGAPELRQRHSRGAAVAASYLASISLRYLLGAQGPGGESIDAKSKVMLSVFDRLTKEWNGEKVHG